MKGCNFLHTSYKLSKYHFQYSCQYWRKLLQTWYQELDNPNYLCSTNWFQCRLNSCANNFPKFWHKDHFQFCTPTHTRDIFLLFQIKTRNFLFDSKYILLPLWWIHFSHHIVDTFRFTNHRINILDYNPHLPSIWK